MNMTINAVNFEMAEKLEQFIEKKMNRFERHLNADDKVEIRMSVIKPQTNDNKEVKIRIAGLFAEKTADSSRKVSMLALPLWKDSWNAARTHNLQNT